MQTPRIRQLLVASTWLLAACASDRAELHAHQQAIIMGDPATDDAYRSVGLLLAHANVAIDGAPAEDRTIGICTGTLISPTAVLTAEHCVNVEILAQSLAGAKDAMGNPRNIVLEGEIGFRFTFARRLADVMAQTADVLEVASVDGHRDFAPLKDPRAAFRPAPAQWNDIAILHLAKAVKGRPTQKLASTERIDSLVADEQTLYRAAGYGLTDDQDQMSAGTLTTGLSHLGKLGAFELTAGADDRQQACRGDSGGPIFADESDSFQMGIASRIDRPFSRGDFGSNNGQPPPCETGLVYTRIDAFADWIAERVDDLPAESPGADDDDTDDEGADDASVDAGGDADGGPDQGSPRVSGGGGCSIDSSHPAAPNALLLLLLTLGLGARRKTIRSPRRRCIPVARAAAPPN